MAEDIYKNLKISLLLDFYGEMLTEKQREAITFYYDHDLSLAEIAKLSGITRQGVRDSIKRAEGQLLEYEEKLGLFEKFHQVQQGLDSIESYIEDIREENQKTIHSGIIENSINSITKKVEEMKLIL